MARKGNVFIFKNGAKCLVVENKVKKGDFDERGKYGSWDDSRWILVNLETGEVELHYRYNIPYEDGMPYIPMYGGVVEILDKLTC
ncbi:hypothetical protein [Niallia sp. FSL M8-0099]|uniref:hypothetical protein n=1 Tax=Niallia sp. FSL M8-0099 TaxID=2954519 RepID=UPI0030FC6F82